MNQSYQRMFNNQNEFRHLIKNPYSYVTDEELDDDDLEIKWVSEVVPIFTKKTWKKAAVPHHYASHSTLRTRSRFENIVTHKAHELLQKC